MLTRIAEAARLLPDWGRKLPETVQRLPHALADLLYPPRCVICRCVDADWFCAQCRSNIEQILPPICDQCGRPLHVRPCPYCQKQPLRIDGIRATAFFEGALREAIHAFKYQHRPELAQVFGSLLGDYAVQHSLQADAVIPVPLHPQRERERGYNQALLLAQAYAAQCHLPVWPDALRRIRFTRSQVELNAAERRENVRDAFEADGCVSGIRILLVDDVCTSGATMDACSVALERRGAKSVWGLALARGR